MPAGSEQASKKLQTITQALKSRPKSKGIKQPKSQPVKGNKGATSKTLGNKSKEVNSAGQAREKGRQVSISKEDDSSKKETSLLDKLFGKDGFPLYLLPSDDDLSRAS